MTNYSVSRMYDISIFHYNRLLQPDFCLTLATNIAENFDIIGLRCQSLIVRFLAKSVPSIRRNHHPEVHNEASTVNPPIRATIALVAI